MTDNVVIIAGGGIGGLATALTLHQIGVPCIVFEAVREMRPLGVGINLQPNAVRELYDLGITEEDLDRVGLPAREWALVGLNGNDIYSEPRGLLAGYNWPQYAVHRGQFHMLLHEKVVKRIGPDAVRLGSRVTGYRKNSDGSISALIEEADGSTSDARGTLLIGADGIHSAVRAQMHPAQPPIHWGGAVMWRGTSWGKPIRSGASFVGLGTHRQRVVFYPISQPDPRTGLSMINWIAEVTMDNSDGWKQSGWFRQVPVTDFVHHFDGWVWDWLDVPDLIRRARCRPAAKTCGPSTPSPRATSSPSSTGTWWARRRPSGRWPSRRARASCGDGSTTRPTRSPPGSTRRRSLSSSARSA
jgi:2-polyprenyl-6-methoxyphenol hydroxylase-like FAD-dependent oxidoreductase